MSASVKSGSGVARHSTSHEREVHFNLQSHEAWPSSRGDSEIQVSEDDLESVALLRRQRANQQSTRYLSRPTTATMKRNFVNRCLTSWPVASILFLNFLGSFAFFGTVQSSVVKAVFVHTLIAEDIGLLAVIQQALTVGLYVFYPVGGILADVYLGRHMSARICLLLVWAASALFGVSTAIGYLLEGNANDIFVTWLPLACLVLYTIASGVFGISLFVFGGDQLFDAPSDTVSSYIYWYWLTKNAGVFLGLLVHTGIVAIKPLEDITAVRFVPVIQPMLSVAILTVAIVFDTCTSTLYDAEHKNTNPIRLVCGVIYNSRQWRQPPPFRSAFRYGEDPPSGLDYARQHHGGKYTDEEVEDVRTFGRIMVFLLSLSGFMILYWAVSSLLIIILINAYGILCSFTQVRSMQKYQLSVCVNSKFKSSVLSSVEGYVFSAVEAIMNAFFVVILIPICNNVLFPIVGQYMPNMKKRIGLGIIVILLASVTMLLLELTVNESQTTRMVWFILPIFLVSLAEVSTAIPCEYHATPSYYSR